MARVEIDRQGIKALVDALQQEFAKHPIRVPIEADMPRSLEVAEPSTGEGHVFISYAREDSDRVDQLQQVLVAAGIRVWRDTCSLWPGEDWHRKVRRAIADDALAFVACFSRQSLGREKRYQNEELLLAIDQLRLRCPAHPWLFPVRFDNCDIPDIDIGGGRTLSYLQRADLFGSHSSEESERLISAILQLLQRPRYHL